MRNISIISFLLLTSLGCTAASYDYEDPNLVITDSYEDPNLVITDS
ncbi:unnamed protein product, partial [Moritella viscosa]